MTTWNPADVGSNTGLFNGYMVATGPISGDSVWSSARATTAQTEGYFEVEILAASPSASTIVGVSDAKFSLSSYLGSSANSCGVQWLNGASGQPFVSGVARANAVSIDGTAVRGDVLMVCVKGGNVWFGRNGVWSPGDPALGTAPNVTGFTGAVFPSVSTFDGVDAVKLNAGGPFKYGPPPGCVPWDAISPQTFLSVTQERVSLRPSRPYIGDIFFNTANSNGSLPFVWNELDLKLIDPAASAAKVAWFEGLKIITSGTVPEVEDFGIVFRIPGDQSIQLRLQDVAGQANIQVNAGNPGGIRENMEARVLVGPNGIIEWGWWKSTPDNGFYCINMWLDRWAK